MNVLNINILLNDKGFTTVIPFSQSFKHQHFIKRSKLYMIDTLLNGLSINIIISDESCIGLMIRGPSTGFNIISMVVPHTLRPGAHHPQSYQPVHIYILVRSMNIIHQCFKYQHLK